MTDGLPSDFIEKVGMLLGASQRAESDRHDLKESIDGLADTVQGLKLAVNGLTQTSASTALSVSALMEQRLDLRVQKAEDRLNRYDRILGGVGSVITKAFVAMLGSGFIGAIIARFIH